MISAGKATLRECQEFYSVEDVYNMIEVMSVDAANRRTIERYYASKD